VNNVAWSPDGLLLASSADDSTIKIWDVNAATELRTLRGHHSGINNIAWHPSGHILASGSLDGTILIWDAKRYQALKTLLGHEEMVITVIWSPDGKVLASSSGDSTIRLWDAASGAQINLLEGHSSSVSCIAYSPDGRLLASKGTYPDSSVRIWRVGTWDVVAALHERSATMWFAGIAFHPNRMLLATLDDKDTSIRIWELDPAVLLAPHQGAKPVQYVTAKVALVGDSGVGKTGLGWRLAHGRFREQPSTHGQQFWIIEELSIKRADGAECEAILWDLAGQPDYRLIHSLFLDDLHVALLLFDPANREKPLSGVEYWLRQLSHTHTQKTPTPAILVGARVDRGTPTLTRQELVNYSIHHGIRGGYLETSAKTGTGVAELIQRIKDLIDWNRIPATVTTSSFRRIKGFIFSLKADKGWKQALLFPETLTTHLHETDRSWDFTQDELVAALRSLQNHGYITLLIDSSGRLAILLFPDLLINIASSIVLEARRNSKGFGALEEKSLVEGLYPLQELSTLSKAEALTLLAAATSLFLKHNICYRESLADKTYLVFPSLINEKRPKEPGIETFDDVSYRISGAVENLYASLVVLLGYTNTFTRTHHWQDQAQYELGHGQTCGFRQVAEHEGEIELILCYGKDTPEYARSLFKGLFEKFLSEHEVEVVRYPSIKCPRCGDRPERAAVRKQLERGSSSLFCGNCGERITLSGTDQVPTLSLPEQKKLTAEQGVASRRTKFETALVWIKSHVRERGDVKGAPRCFISYAWDVPEHERWVLTLAKDLRNAGVEVVFDRWQNTPGTSIVKFIEQIRSADFVLAVGTPTYLAKYNAESSDAVVEAELRLIGTRLRKRGAVRERVIPLLLDGEQATAFPPQFEDSVFIDFRLERQHFVKLLDLVLTIYEIRFDQPGVEEFRESLISSSM
jgi:small GTP-binding protein